MKYLIKQKLFAIADSYTIYDENENPAYLANFKLLSIRNKFNITDLNGNELYNCEKKIFSFLPEFYINKGDKQVGILKKRLTFFKPKFYIKSSFGNYNLEGDFFQYNFDFYKNGKNVVDINKAFFTLRDTYGVHIKGDEDHAFILANVIILDFLFHNSS